MDLACLTAGRYRLKSLPHNPKSRHCFFFFFLPFSFSGSGLLLLYFLFIQIDRLLGNLGTVCFAGVHCAWVVGNLLGFFWKLHGAWSKEQRRQKKKEPKMENPTVMVQSWMDEWRNFCSLW